MAQFWDWRKPVYFSAKAEAEVYGENISFHSRVACEPTSTPSGILFNSKDIFVQRRKFFGKKLNTGEGFFILVPDICEWFFKQRGDSLEWSKDEQEINILPAAFITNNYDNPENVRVFADPNGSDPRAEVVLKDFTVRPLARSKISHIPALDSNLQNPFSKKVDKRWIALFFLPVHGEFGIDAEQFLDEPVVTDSKFSLFLVNQWPGKIHPQFYFNKYWLSITEGAPLRHVTATTALKQNEAIGDKYAFGLDYAKEEYSNIVPVMLDGSELAIRPRVDGLHLTSVEQLKAAHANNNNQSNSDEDEELLIRFGGVTVRVGEKQHVFLKSNNSGRIYILSMFLTHF